MHGALCQDWRLERETKAVTPRSEPTKAAKGWDDDNAAGAWLAKPGQLGYFIGIETGANRTGH